MCDNHNHEDTCCHGHEHEHTHEGECCHGHEHGHDHEGECCHGHEHAAQSPEETMALLTYMLDHNRHHGEDLHEIYHALEAAGKNDAAAVLHEAMHLYGHANDMLEKALDLLK